MSNEKTIESMATEGRVINPTPEISASAHVGSMEQYRRDYRRSVDDPEAYWAEKALELDWTKKWEKVLSYDFNAANIEWFTGGKLNVSVNCVDRHIKRGKQNVAAIIWEGDDERETRVLTYGDLYRDVNRFALALRANGVKKGDRVAIYLPMIPELAVAMLACARIGAPHSIVFGGFSAESLKSRIADSTPEILITSDGGWRGGKMVPLKTIADQAVAAANSPIKKVIVVRHAGADVAMTPGRDAWWHEEMAKIPHSAFCPPEEMDAEDPLFLLYTSGSTGKPKGVLHTTAGYLLFAQQTFKDIFDYKEGETFWCTADVGWITGHSYVVYGPLAQGATSLMFEGVPTHPDPGRFWRVVDRHAVNIFYTAPTVIRALAREGEQWPEKYDLSSLRVLGTVGEPINPEAWMWYYDNIGRKRIPVVDTWWQTETGGILISPLPGATPLKPGSATLPYFGVEPEVVRQDGSRADVNEGGYLVLKKPWPGIMRRVYGDEKRFKETYFTTVPGKYFTGDGARVDKDGYYWLMGRIDDVINISGHRIGTAEVESALVSHRLVAEAAVVGMPHDIKGQALYAYVILKAGAEASPALERELKEHVAKEIGAIARPDIIHLAGALPKTRSGKIMRRILRKIAENDVEHVGDVSTLADPSVVEALIASRKMKQGTS